jgi:alpha-L-arabinofuranosidase
MVTIRADATTALHDVSPLLFGIFLEDINFACEGGLNANLINNHSFDGVYLNPQDMMTLFTGGAPLVPVYDRLRYWHTSEGTLESRQDDPASSKSWYGRVRSDGQTRLENLGYNGGIEHAADPAMSIVADKDYVFSCWLRAVDYQGQISVFIADTAGQPLTTVGALSLSTQWQELHLRLAGSTTGYGKLVVTFDGVGAVDLDCISFYDADTWGKDDPKWSQGKLRRDLVEVLRPLKPAFLRFPGGSIVAGIAPGNEYRWKDSIGPLIERTPNWSMWGMSIPDGGYSQSLQVGFYEYFLLCEDLGAEPLPDVWAGLNVNLPGGPTNVVAPVGGPEFQEQVVQNALDLIAYATGDPATNAWARLRAEAGHAAPFNLRYLEIGNENTGEEYLAAFEAVKAAIDAASPGITCVLSTGVSVRETVNMGPFGEVPNTGRDLALERALERFPDVLLDEHFYELPEWVLAKTSFYDSFPRGGAKVFLGEYAANAPSLRFPGRPPAYLKPNCFATALAEAAFLTGIERNSDVVALTCYAPLFALAERSQWEHCLITFNPAHVLKTANYHVQQMYVDNIGAQVVALEGELPEQVYASATASTDRLIVKLVNANAESVQATLQLAGIAGSHATVTSLQADDPEAANELGFVGAPVEHIQPRTTEVAITDGSAVLELAGHGFYVVVADR